MASEPLEAARGGRHEFGLKLDIIEHRQQVPQQQQVDEMKNTSQLSISW